MNGSVLAATANRLSAAFRRSPDRSSKRIDAIDAARAVALLAMAAYHATWDVGFLRLTPANYALTPAGRLVAHVVAGSFLALVGIGLVLMNGERLRWRLFLLRLVRIGGAAVLITLATWFAFPDSYIFFGILHCIAVSSVLALPFLYLPPALTALCAVAVIAAPYLVPHPPFEAKELFFLGLGSRLPATNDWVPLFPWFGTVLVGVVIARVGLPALARSRLGLWRAQGVPARVATFAGRHSLALYLVHQPVLLAAFFGLVSLTGPHPKAGLAEFRADVLAKCIRDGGSPAACRITGRCTADALRRDGLWDIGPTYTVEQRMQAQTLLRRCYRAAEGTEPAP